MDVHPWYRPRWIQPCRKRFFTFRGNNNAAAYLLSSNSTFGHRYGTNRINCQAVTPGNRLSETFHHTKRIKPPAPLSLRLHCYLTTTNPTFPTFFI